MSLQRISLRKLLRLFYAPNAKRIEILRVDIRTEIARDLEEDDDGGGGDFYVPFWSDAKDHAAGASDLRLTTAARIEVNSRRGNLYPRLLDGFLRWWNDTRRRINEPFQLIRDSISALFPVDELDAIVKVENVLALRVGDNSDRVIYPYFSVETPLTEEGARIGLWLLGQSLRRFNLSEIQILDVFRGRSFSNRDLPFRGDERRVFLTRYRALIAEWERLRREYD